MEVITGLVCGLRSLAGWLHPVVIPGRRFHAGEVRHPSPTDRRFPRQTFSQRLIYRRGRLGSSRRVAPFVDEIEAPFFQPALEFSVQGRNA